MKNTNVFKAQISRERNLIFFLCYCAIQYRYIFTDYCFSDFSWVDFIFFNLFVAIIYYLLLLILYQFGKYLDKPEDDQIIDGIPNPRYLLRLVFPVLGLFPIITGHFDYLSYLGYSICL